MGSMVLGMKGARARRLAREAEERAALAEVRERFAIGRGLSLIHI